LQQQTSPSVHFHENSIIHLKLFYEQNWYDKEFFAEDRGEVAWQLVCKTPVDNSLSKDWPEQQALISKDDEVPSAQVMVYTIIGHFFAIGERLFEKVYVRTSSIASGGSRVNVGSFDRSGLDIRSNLDGGRYGNVGLASSMKVPELNLEN